MLHTRNLLFTAVTTFVLAFGLVNLVIGSAHAQVGSDWDKVTAAARSEGKLVLYNGTNFRAARVIAGQFSKQYGIAVDVLDGRTTEIRERIRTEQAAGRNIGDVVFASNTTLSLQHAEGAFQKHGPIPKIDNLGPTIGANGTIVPISVGNFAVLYNSNLVKPADAPASWHDLTDPKWKGKILSDDPRARGAGAVWFETTLEKFGREFHDKMAAQNLVFSRVYAESHLRIARGEYAIYLPFNVSEYTGLKGLPLKVLAPTEGVPFVEFSLAILKGAPHPNTARLFLDFVLSPEGQTTVAVEGLRPTARGMERAIPNDLAPFVQAPGLGTTTPERSDAMLALAKEIYK